MRTLFFALPFALAISSTSPVPANAALGDKASSPGGSAQEFASSRRKYSGPRGGSR